MEVWKEKKRRYFYRYRRPGTHISGLHGIFTSIEMCELAYLRAYVSAELFFHSGSAKESQREFLIIIESEGIFGCARVNAFFRFIRAIVN